MWTGGLPPSRVSRAENVTAPTPRRAGCQRAGAATPEGTGASMGDGSRAAVSLVVVAGRTRVASSYEPAGLRPSERSRRCRRFRRPRRSVCDSGSVRRQRWAGTQG
jgi:hypothetical protein